MKLTVELSEDEFRYLREKAARYALKPEELLEAFISDLVGDGHGSDERMLADQWYERNSCNFDTPDTSFISHLAHWYGLDEFVDCCKSYSYAKEELEGFREELDAALNHPDWLTHVKKTDEPVYSTRCLGQFENNEAFIAALRQDVEESEVFTGERRDEVLEMIQEYDPACEDPTQYAAEVAEFLGMTLEEILG